MISIRYQHHHHHHRHYHHYDHHHHHHHDHHHLVTSDRNELHMEEIWSHISMGIFGIHLANFLDNYLSLESAEGLNLKKRCG